ncbi:MAG TPA: ABC transporter substrate-binding protein [Waterburya sp.]|jgi:multiple sugar transport system substrate-binding protein
MTDNQPLSQLREFLQRRGITPIWGLAALLQILMVLILLLTWPVTPPVNLTLVVPAFEATYWSSLIHDFEAKNRNIRISLVEVKNRQGDLTEKLKEFYTINFQSGNAYDLIYMDVIWISEFADRGWLLDLSERISRHELAKFLESDVIAGRYQGKLYRIPFRSDFGLLYYRKDLLEKAKLLPPKTFQELLKTSQALQKRRLAPWGYLWQGREYEGLSAMFVEVLQGYGGFWIKPASREVGLDRLEAIAAVKFLVNTMEQKISPVEVVSYSEDESFTQFQQGHAVFLRGWPYMWTQANAPDSPIQGNVGIQAMTLHAKYRSGGGCNGSWGLGIAKTSKHPNQAWKAIAYLTSAKVQHKFTLETGYIPSRKTLLNDPKILRKYPHFPQLSQALQHSVLRPPIPEYARASEILQRYLNQALRRESSPEEAMKAAASETRQLLVNH